MNMNRSPVYKRFFFEETNIKDATHFLIKNGDGVKDIVKKYEIDKKIGFINR